MTNDIEKQIAAVNSILRELESLRLRANKKPDEYPPDYAIRVCQAIVAAKGGYPDRVSWKHIIEGVL